METRDNELEFGVSLGRTLAGPNLDCMSGCVYGVLGIKGMRLRRHAVQIQWVWQASVRIVHFGYAMARLRDTSARIIVIAIESICEIRSSNPSATCQFCISRHIVMTFIYSEASIVS